MTCFALPAVIGAVAAALMASPASAQLFTDNALNSNWDSARWSTSVGGPFTSAWVSGSDTSFSGQSFVFGRMATNNNGTTTIGNITVADSGTIGFNNTGSQRVAAKSGGATITVGNNGLVIFNTLSVVSGTNNTALTKSGAGAFALTGGAYAGGFTLNDGLVIAQGNQALGTGALTINGGVIGASGNRVFGSSSVSILGDVQLGSTSSIAGSSSTANLTFGSAIALGGPGVRTLTLGNNGLMNLNGLMSGGNGLRFTKVDGATGSFSIGGSGTNSYGGNTEIEGTTVQVSNAYGFSSGSITLSGTSDSQLRINTGLTLANNLVIADSTARKLITNSGSTANLTGSITNNDTTPGGFVLAADAGKTLNVTGTIGGTGGIQLGDAGLAGTVVLGRANTYAGNTTIASGLVQLGNNAAIRNDLDFLGTSTLDLYGFHSSLNSVAGTSGTITSSAPGSTLSIGGDNSTSTLKSAIVDFNGNSSLGVSLVKDGTGTLTLQGAGLQYSGLTTVNDGILDVRASNKFLGAFLVASPGTLTGSATIQGDLTVLGDLDARVGGSSVGTFNAANISIDAASTTTLQVDSATVFSSLNALGSLTYGGSLVLRFDNTSRISDGTEIPLFTAGGVIGNFATIDTDPNGGFYSGLQFTYDPARGNWYSNNPAGDIGQHMIFTPSTGLLAIVPVPEPSTWAMTLASVGFAGWMARRKKLARKRRLA